MSTFPELDASLGEANGDTLSLPIGGKNYEFTASIPMERGIQIARMREETARLLKAKANDPEAEVTVRDATRDELDDESELQLYLDLIGEDMRQRMADDGVSWPDMLRVGSTLFAWHFSGEAAARIAWQAKPGDADPPAEPPASSGDPKTSQSTSTKKKTAGSAAKGKAKASGSATTSTAGHSSKATSTASTKSTSRPKKS